MAQRRKSSHGVEAPGIREGYTVNCGERRNRAKYAEERDRLPLEGASRKRTTLCAEMTTVAEGCEADCKGRRNE